MTPSVARLVIGQGMFSIGMVPYSIYWVDYVVRGLGHDIDFGGLLWALFGLGALTGTLLWGRLADRIGFGALHRSPGVVFDRFRIDHHHFSFGMMVVNPKATAKP